MKNTIEAVVEIPNLNLRKGPGKKYQWLGFIEPGTYEISKVVDSKDAENGYGKLADGSGWISMDFVTKKEFQYLAGSPLEEETEG